MKGACGLGSTYEGLKLWLCAQSKVDEVGYAIRPEERRDAAVDDIALLPAKRRKAATDGLEPVAPLLQWSLTPYLGSPVAEFLELHDRPSLKRATERATLITR